MSAAPLLARSGQPAKLLSMHSLYNRVAGQSVERLAALSDGIFAVSMTLLVLDLRVPAGEAIRSERDLWHALAVLSPRLIIFLMSVMTNGIFWVGQQTQLNQFARADRNLAWIHIAFLCAITLTPFSTSLLAEFIHYRIALLVYWFNILLLGLMLYWSWGYATRAHLLADDVPAEVHPAVIRRIVIAQSLYAAGAALCFLNTYYSIASIVLVQVNYAIAPRFCWGLFSRKAESKD
jgi:TMEM175 potassium channel family protein